MHGHDARIFRGAAIPTAAVGLLAVIVSALVAGSKGVIGAALGLVIVVAFFTVSLLAVSLAARVSPMVMMQAALFSYVVKILALAGLVAVLRGVTVWDPRAFAWVVIVCTLVWIAAEVRAFLKEKILYVEPGSGPAGGRPKGEDT